MTLLESITALLSLTAIAVLVVAMRAAMVGDLVGALAGLVALFLSLAASVRMARWAALDRSVR